MASNTVRAHVSVLHGFVFAKNNDGGIRRLALGDPVFMDEVILSGTGAYVELANETNALNAGLSDKEAANIAESQGQITLSGTVSGTEVKAGDVVTLTAVDAAGAVKHTYQATVAGVAGAYTYSTQAPGGELALDDKVIATLTVTDKAGNATTVKAEQDYDVDTAVPAVSITLDKVTSDNSISMCRFPTARIWRRRRCLSVFRTMRPMSARSPDPT